MIIRILGEGQFRVPDTESQSVINSADDAIEAAVEADDQQALADALQRLHDTIIEHATALPDEELQHSDVIVPGTDATLAEVRELLSDSDEGLIPNPT